ncbi:MAG: GbsR/MarR family transcriptional regulator [Cellvibrionaceae bacterium]
MTLTAGSEAFVLHFGEMGSRWGFNRTVGQIYALLVIHEGPLNADQIGELLSISRSNVSMGIKELQSWRLVNLHHKPGDRKDYFSVAGSIWEMASTVFEERRKRELDPTLSLLRTHLLDTPESSAEVYAQEKMQEIHDLLEMLNQWANSLNTLSPEALQSLMKLGSGVSKLLDFKSKVTRKDND